TALQVVELLEELGSFARIPAGMVHGLDAEAVRLAFVVATPTLVGQETGTSPASNSGGACRVVLDEDGRGGRDNADPHGALDAQQAVSLGDVVDLVSEHGGDLCFVVRIQDEPQVHIAESAGDGKGVDRPVSGYMEGE